MTSNWAPFTSHFHRCMLGSLKTNMTSLVGVFSFAWNASAKPSVQPQEEVHSYLQSNCLGYKASMLHRPTIYCLIFGIKKMSCLPSCLGLAIGGLWLPMSSISHFVRGSLCVQVHVHTWIASQMCGWYLQDKKQFLYPCNQSPHQCSQNVKHSWICNYVGCLTCILCTVRCHYDASFSQSPEIQTAQVPLRCICKEHLLIDCIYTTAACIIRIAFSAGQATWLGLALNFLANADPSG